MRSRTDQARVPQVRRSAVAVALALPLLTGVTACGEVQQSSQGVAQTSQNTEQPTQRQNAEQAAESLCIKYFKLPLPNMITPERAATTVQKTLQGVEQLIGQANNETLKRQLVDMRRSLTKFARGEVSQEEIRQWFMTYLDKSDKVRATCSNLTD